MSATSSATRRRRPAAANPRSTSVRLPYPSGESTNGSSARSAKVTPGRSASGWPAGSSAAPASVSTTRCELRSNSRVPSSRSRARIAAETPDCTTRSRCAARVKFRSSATVTKYTRWRSSTASIIANGDGCQHEDSLVVLIPAGHSILMTSVLTPAPAATERAATRRLTHEQGFWAIAFAFAVSLAFTVVPTPLWALYQRHDGYSTIAVTGAFAAYAFGVIASLFLAGHGSDWLGRRRMLLPAVLLEAGSATLVLTSTSLGVGIVARVLSGLGIGMIT